MPVEAVMAFWAVSILFVLTPGADWAYVMSAGLRYRTVLPAVGGLLSGHLLMTAVVAAGVAALVAQTPGLLTVVTAAGAIYLMWLGLGTLTDPPVPPATDDRSPQTRWRQVVAGLGVSGLNPKVLLLFLALLPQFTSPHGAWPVALQILTLGAVHAIGCAVVYLGVGVGARAVLRARPAAAKVVGSISGVLMMCIGAALLVGQFAA